jgi:probable phosphomutase (TIGR03848 family)
MTTILLIRHGENDYVKKGRMAGRLPGVHLNETGKAQAGKLAETLADWPVKAVYSSPLDRTVETAQPIASALGLEAVTRQNLSEVDVGAWQDKTLKDLRRRKLWRTVQMNPARMHFPAGETFAAAQNRMRDALEWIVGEHKPKDLVVCVSHSDPIKLAVAYYIGMPLDMFQRLSISPASISGLHFHEHGAHLFMLNYKISFTLGR